MVGSDYMRPNYVFKAGSETFTPDTADGLISIDVKLSMGLPIDGVEVVLVGAKELSFSSTDPVEVQLGYDDNLFQIFSGFVADLKRETSDVRLTALSWSATLLHLRINRVYLNQEAGQIVRDLAGQAGFDMKECEGGIVFPMYAIDDGKNVYEHILKLAERCNFDVYVAEDRKLVFKEYKVDKVHSLEYGENIIRVEGVETPTYGKVTVYGEGGSFKGAETFHWLTKDEVKGEAGDLSPETVPFIIRDPAIRNREDAQNVADAETKGLGEDSYALFVEVVGDPEVKLGETVETSGFDDSWLNDKWKIRGVRHYLSKTKGFTTTIKCTWVS